MPSYRSRSLAIAFTLFARLSYAYLLTYRGVFTAGTDEGALVASVEGLVKWDWPTANQMPLGHNGRYRDGIFYTTYEPAQYLLATPLYAAASLLPRVGLLQTVFLFDTFVTTLAAVLVSLYVHRFGYGHRVATLCVLAFGLLTSAWLYSKTFWREPLSGPGLVDAM